MRIAHLLITYTDPLLTEKMIRKMEHPQFDFYIHVDKKMDITSHLFLAKMPNVYLIKDRVDVVWGGYNTVEATLRSVKEIFSKGIEYDYIHLMSGQDYPIKPAWFIYNFFEENKGKEFTEYEHFDDWADESYPRIREYHLTNYKFPGRYYVQWLMNKCLPVRKSPIPMTFYGSSMFWAFTTDCLKYILSFLEHNPRFKRFIELTWGCDEFMFQTIVLNSPFKESVVNNNLLYLDRVKGAPHPNVLTINHLSHIQISDKLFARKFDMARDKDILNSIDQYLNSFGQNEAILAARQIILQNKPA